MLVSDLCTSGIFTPGRIVRLVKHVLRYGVQLGNVMHMSANMDSIAIRQGNSQVTYRELFNQTASVSGYLYETFDVKQGSAVLLIVDNALPSVVLLLALSALGCNIHIMAPMKDEHQFRATVDLSSYDFVFSGLAERYRYYETMPVRSITTTWSEAIGHRAYKPFVRMRTTISIFTSGSTGIAKRTKRSNTLWQYLNAISDVVKTVGLQRYTTVMLPVPIYHSYGLSSLFLGLMLNKTLVFVNKFDAAEVSKEIERYKVEVAILIPQMIYRLLNYNLSTVRCIVSCSDVLPVTVFQAAKNRFGDIIFNFYGTSETGLATVATPDMLAVKPETVGRPIKGCKLELRNEDGNPVLYVKSSFAMHSGYLRTGDIAAVDERGWYALHGRADHLIVINGVNVYPNELLQMAYRNDGVQHAEVRAFTNEQGFKKIKLILSAKDTLALDEMQFKDWWVQQYGTKFLPAVIEFKADDHHVKLMHT
ncbi:Acyl-CoA synthetase (AMP-forming)/AMP-acid ligase II [Chryseolinea serpens]|uniref:Acyl-CoA synthetase (AMP-forming)/AMP-acid ligase II n=1 Tax=Chryseolinea serpens TaxID=947013 RepID=A0A1M5JW97_9BACT|nr:AMP-binding protein [Chryseolinea serpens]SHG44499.1 Acyl-CoA synthetase (AMP-forming)/AMP-acid ligase II [Chryseolinea serpens]